VESPLCGGTNNRLLFSTVQRRSTTLATLFDIKRFSSVQAASCENTPIPPFPPAGLQQQLRKGHHCVQEMAGHNSPQNTTIAFSQYLQSYAADLQIIVCSNISDFWIIY